MPSGRRSTTWPARLWYVPFGGTPEVILRELGKIAIGDILLETTDGQKLSLRRVARPSPEQKRILEALRLEIPERLSPDRVL